MCGQPELSIIIVNWNSTQYACACLESIVAALHGVEYEVIVVDNHSTHDDLDDLISAFPFVRLIRNERDVGFARANNIGFSNSSAPWLLFLNPDTQIVGKALQAMLRVLKERPDAGIVGCRLLNTDHTPQTSCVQRYPRVLNQVFGSPLVFASVPGQRLWGLTPLFQQTDEPMPVEVISGACMMLRRDLFVSVGQFSEEYFMYAEDVDLCYRAAKAGWRCYFVGNATIVHHGGGSSRLRPVSTWAAVVQCGAKLQFVRKTRGGTYANLYRLAMAASAAIRWLLLTCMAGVSKGRPRGEYMATCRRKWADIFRWALRPEATRLRLTGFSAE